LRFICDQWVPVQVREYVRDVGDQAGQKWRIFESGDGKTFKSFKTAANAGFIPIEDSDVD